MVSIASISHGSSWRNYRRRSKRAAVRIARGRGVPEPRPHLRRARGGLRPAVQAARDLRAEVQRAARSCAAGGDGLPSLEIASRMITRVPDVTRIVDRLETQGLVKRERTTADLRVVLVSITRKGLDLSPSSMSRRNKFIAGSFSTSIKRSWPSFRACWRKPGHRSEASRVCFSTPPVFFEHRWAKAHSSTATSSIGGETFLSAIGRDYSLRHLRGRFVSMSTSIRGRQESTFFIGSANVESCATCHPERSEGSRDRVRLSNWRSFASLRMTSLQLRRR